jgi:hypothetical protein
MAGGSMPSQLRLNLNNVAIIAVDS